MTLPTRNSLRLSPRTALFDADLTLSNYLGSGFEFRPAGVFLVGSPLDRCCSNSQRPISIRALSRVIFTPLVQVVGGTQTLPVQQLLFDVVGKLDELHRSHSPPIIAPRFSLISIKDGQR
jgi:hypothetical protein